jgi:hypothetical protein
MGVTFLDRCFALVNYVIVRFFIYLKVAYHCSNVQKEFNIALNNEFAFQNIICLLPYRPLYPWENSPQYPLDGDWVGPRASLDVAAKRKISCLCWESD